MNRKLRNLRWRMAKGVTARWISPWALGSFGFWFVCFSVLDWVGLSNFLEHRVVRPLEFRTREVLNLSPTIHPRLKAFALDDGTASMLNSVDIPAEDWVRLLKSLVARQPKAILIDKLFSSDGHLTAEQREAIKSLSTIEVPIAAGALITPTRIRYRTALDPKIFREIFHELPKSPIETNRAVKHLGDSYVYGPTPLYQTAFRHIGHVVQWWPARFAPVISIGDGTLVPHVALFAAGSRKLGDDSLWLDGQVVPVDDGGLSIINYLPIRDSIKGIRTLRQIIQKSRRGETLTEVDRGDVVLLINSYSTGNADILDSPYGLIPGGFVILAITNTVMSGNWLEEFGDRSVFMAGAVLAGGLLGLSTTALSFWMAVIGSVSLYLVICLAGFSWGGMVVPWFFPIMAFTATGCTGYAIRRSEESRRRLQLELELATASALQQRFFPEPKLTHQAFTIESFYQPAKSVGGDWYAYYLYRDEWLHIHLGDVTGHGTSAALLATFAKGATDLLYEEYERTGQSQVPLELIHRNLNELLARNRGERALLTMMSIAVNFKTARGFYLNSGHRPAMMLGRDCERPKLLTTRSSTILGFKPDLGVIVPGRLDLVGNETFLIYTDGIIDVPLANGVAISERKMANILMEQGHRNGLDLKNGLIDQISAGGTLFFGERDDDMTFLIVKLHFSPQRTPQFSTSDSIA